MSVRPWGGPSSTTACSIAPRWTTRTRMPTWGMGREADIAAHHDRSARQLGRVGHEVDLGDAIVADGDPDDADELVAVGAEQPRRAVDDRGPHELGEDPAAPQGVARHGLGADDRLAGAPARGAVDAAAGVVAEPHARVEHRDERVEV